MTDRINKVFNEELQKQIDGTLPIGHVYQLGRPGIILLAAGVEDLSMELESGILFKKSSVGYHENHPFDMFCIMNLPNAMNNPIAVFDDGFNTVGGKRILIDLQHNGHNFLVVMRVYTLKKNRKVNVRVNSIRTIFPKDKVGDVFDWFFTKNDLLRWVDKKKALNFVSIHSTLSNVDGNDIRAQKVIAKINSFQNPAMAGCSVDRINNKIIYSPEKVNSK